jgi:uncharacterized surface protein with fasciclin (FAS1) repeats
MSQTIKRVALATSAVSLLFATVACGSNDDKSSSSPAAAASSSTSATTSDTPSAMPSVDNAAGLVGPGCADYAKANPTGAGSVDGMAAAPVATAASGNPLLKTLVASVSGKLNPKVDLVSTLNGGEFTVFAPVDEAFGKLPKATVKTLSTPQGAKTLQTVLTYHVVPEQMLPDQIAGQTLTTVQGGTVKVTGSGDNLKVNGANVICGGVKTANATVYLIDTVMMPKM